jgi:hypothetical protein
LNGFRYSSTAQLPDDQQYLIAEQLQNLKPDGAVLTLRKENSGNWLNLWKAVFMSLSEESGQQRLTIWPL